MAISGCSSAAGNWQVLTIPPSHPFDSVVEEWRVVSNAGSLASDRFLCRIPYGGQEHGHFRVFRCGRRPAGVQGLDLVCCANFMVLSEILKSEILLRYGECPLQMMSRSDQTNFGVPPNAHLLLISCFHILWAKKAHVWPQSVLHCYCIMCVYTCVKLFRITLML